MQQLPQLDPQHAIPVALASVAAFFVCFLITHLSITPRITRALLTRESNLSQLELMTASMKAEILVKVAELEQIRSWTTYGVLHREWELEYKKILASAHAPAALAHQAYWTTQLRLHNLDQTPELGSAHRSIVRKFFGETG